MFELRPVSSEDAMRCFEWANDPAVRANSHNSKPIELEGHLRWFESKLQDKSSFFYIAEADQEPVGQIRFDGEEEKIISFLLAPDARGKGFGTKILQQGLAKLKADFPEVRKVVGYVKHTNTPSNKAFERAGFKLDEPDMAHPDSNKYFIIL